MSAIICCHPGAVGDPPKYQYDKDWKYNFYREQEWVYKVAKWAKKNNPTSKVAGKEFRYPVGDGSARFIVVSLRPLTLIHLPVGDCWNVTEVVRKGLDAKHVKEYCHPVESYYPE